MSPRVSDQHAESRRQQIIQAARTCFTKKGFHRASMRDVSAEAGLSIGAVYCYFKSKEEIITAIADQERQFMGEVFANSAKGDPEQAMTQVIRTFFMMMDDPCAPDERYNCVSLWGEAVSNPQVRAILKSLRDELLGHLKQMVVVMQSVGEIDPALDARSVAQVMLATHSGMVLQMVINDDVNLPEYVKVIEALRFGPVDERSEP